MSKSDTNLPDVNALLKEKLRAFPGDVAELAMMAVQLSEQHTENTVIQMLQGHIRETSRKQGGER